MAFRVEVVLAVEDQKPLGDEPAKPTDILGGQGSGVRRGVPYPKEIWLPGYPCVKVDDQLCEFELRAQPNGFGVLPDSQSQIAERRHHSDGRHPLTDTSDRKRPGQWYR